MILVSRRRYSNGNGKYSSPPTSVWSEPCAKQAKLKRRQLLFFKQRINNYRGRFTEKLPAMSSFETERKSKGQGHWFDCHPPPSLSPTPTHSSEMMRNASHAAELLCHHRGLSHTFEEVTGLSH